MTSPDSHTTEAPRRSAAGKPIFREGHCVQDAATRSADRPDPPLVARTEAAEPGGGRRPQWQSTSRPSP
jgi:hypothetical protein